MQAFSLSWPTNSAPSSKKPWMEVEVVACEGGCIIGRMVCVSDVQVRGKFAIIGWGVDWNAVA